MIQIMPVGKGVLLAITDAKVRPEVYQYLSEKWNDYFPDVSGFVIGPAQIVVRDGQPILFEFTGEITPTVVAEFQRWWEEVTNG